MSLKKLDLWSNHSSFTSASRKKGTTFIPQFRFISLPNHSGRFLLADHDPRDETYQAYQVASAGEHQALLHLKPAEIAAQFPEHGRFHGKLIKSDDGFYVMLGSPITIAPDDTPTAVAAPPPSPKARQSIRNHFVT